MTALSLDVRRWLCPAVADLTFRWGCALGSGFGLEADSKSFFVAERKE
jgi:hypothetical protein